MLGFRYDMYFSVLYCYETGPIVLIKIGPVPYNQGPVPWSSVYIFLGIQLQWLQQLLKVEFVD